MEKATFVIIGGGIAGVSCAENIAFLAPEQRTILLTESSLIKAVTNLVPLGKMSAKFDIEERSAETISTDHKCIQIIKGNLKTIHSKTKIIETACGLKIQYEYLCLCTGGRPKIITEAAGNPNIIGIRDTESIKQFQEKVAGAKRIVIVGNGGIASELVHEIKGTDIIWVVRDKHISATFVDPGAAEFFQPKLKKEANANLKATTSIKRMQYTDEDKSGHTGAALGPDWHRHLNIRGSEQLPSSVTVHYECEIKSVSNYTAGKEWAIVADLTNGERISCDLIVSATGVTPYLSYECDDTLELGPDGGISVDWRMHTSVADIYAAGDVCYAAWKPAEHWFQMRLWSQARQMGAMAARSMAAVVNKEETLQDFCFELFAHVTQLFGYQVVLLGKYNGQGLDNKYEILLRVTPGVEYIKLVLVNGRVQGAVLIGETGLEETFENLILNQLDVSQFGEDLLNPDIDIEDYFD